ncbi:MAG TPA: glycosyltransferase family 2 protein [Nitrospira sp.]|nr:glycosyltransferase family 2 protein [Nitrospira sp.]
MLRSLKVPVALIVPCYNEEATIPFLKEKLERLKEHIESRYDFHYVFVDDASTDATLDVLKHHFSAWPNVTFLKNQTNLGIAGATLNGIRSTAADIVCSIDCDCTFDPEHLAVMLPLLTDGVDVVTASPYHPEGGVDGVPVWRITLSKGASVLYRTVLKQKLASYTTCCRVYRRSAIQDVTLRHSDFVGITEILARMDFNGARVVEVPAVLGTRQYGQSKMRVLRTALGHLDLLSRCALARLRLSSL